MHNVITGLCARTAVVISKAAVNVGSYVCGAGVQDHQTQLQVLGGVQLVNQLPVVSLQSARSATRSPSKMTLRAMSTRWGQNKSHGTDHVGRL